MVELAAAWRPHRYVATGRRAAWTRPATAGARRDAVATVRGPEGRRGRSGAAGRTAPAAPWGQTPAASTGTATSTSRGFKPTPKAIYPYPRHRAASSDHRRPTIRRTLAQALARGSSHR